MPREKKEVFEYNSDGSFHRSHESIADFAKCYNLQKNINSTRKNVFDVFYEFSDGRVASERRIGKKGVRDYKRYSRSPYVGHRKSQSMSIGNGWKYRFIDLDGDLIATFESDWHCRLLTNIDVKHLFHHKPKSSRSRTSDGIIVERFK